MFAAVVAADNTDAVAAPSTDSALATEQASRG